MKIKISISVDPDVANAIDKSRGIAARSTYINELLKVAVTGDILQTPPVTVWYRTPTNAQTKGISANV